MKEETIYIPKKGDIVLLAEDYPGESENPKMKKGLVVSRYAYNRKTMFAVICPILASSMDSQARYTLPEGLETEGQVFITQFKTVDCKIRKLKQVERVPLQDIAKIDQFIEYIFLYIFWFGFQYFFCDITIFFMSYS